MDNIISTLSEIEDASAAIIAEASDRKQAITDEMNQKQLLWDNELEDNAAKELEKISQEVSESIKQKLSIQEKQNDEDIDKMRKEYEQNKSKYLDILFSQMIGE
jgi:hypothetical protein